MTSVTIILFEITLRQTSLSFKHFFWQRPQNITVKWGQHARNSPATFVSHKHFVILFFLTSCCINSLILPCTHLLFTSQSISIYITLHTPVVYQSVHIYLYYPVHTCCLPVSPYLSILPCTHLLFTSQSISIYITLYTPVVYQSVHIFLLISSCPLPPLCEENISSWILVLTCPAPTCLGDAARNARRNGHIIEAWYLVAW